MSPPLPSHTSLTLPILQSLLELYPQVLLRFYESKVKDAKKRSEAIENDKWRYETLPTAVEGKKQKEGLSQAEVERLVLWKITHQTNRPFLLPQIRKNPPSVIPDASTKTQEILLQSSSSRPSMQTVTSALAAASVPKGIGPATAALLLSVFSPRHVPFFEDELHAWIFPGHAKLKYNIKEYTTMVEEVWSLMDQLNDEGTEEVKAWMLEKAGFVIGHWDLLDESEKEGVLRLTAKNTKEVKSNGGNKRKRESKSEAEETEIDEISQPPTEVSSTKKIKKEGKQEFKTEEKAPEEHTKPRRSERKR